MAQPSKRMKLVHNETKDFLKENTQLTKATHQDYVSVRETVFFQNPSTHQFEEGNTPLPKKYITFMNKYNFPMKIKLFWIILGNPDDEIKSQGFTLMSLSQIEKDEDNYLGFVDIGIKYMGMGHIMVLSIDKVTGNLFIRTDGGSNGYDREAYWKYYQGKKPNVDFIDKFLNLDQVFQLLKCDEIDESIPIVCGY